MFCMEVSLRHFMRETGKQPLHTRRRWDSQDSKKIIRMQDEPGTSSLAPSPCRRFLRSALNNHEWKAAGVLPYAFYGGKYYVLLGGELTHTGFKVSPCVLYGYLTVSPTVSKCALILCAPHLMESRGTINNSCGVISVVRGERVTDHEWDQSIANP